ncbi:MAG: sigma-54-dependent Fis family transcriptional regulator [bacterium]|nr:sigma-54-dependent Fis family transcriptional regulator [bacterium]
MTRTVSILVAEDDEAAGYVINLNLSREGFTPTVVTHAADALRALEEKVPDLLLTDYRMPGMSGLELLEEVRRAYPNLPVVMMTGHGDERLAVESMRQGAFTYLAKPLDYDELVLVCRRAAEMHRLRRRLDQARNLQLGQGLIGDSVAMKRLRRLIAEVAPTDVTVLVRGETGTGKEVVAQAIHSASPRSAKPFVAINCSAIPDTLLESELFGHERGAFTGADRRRPGRFQAASGGTLFLDEIGDLPTALQPKLLRVLEDHAVTPLGSDSPVDVNVRMVAATNQPLEALVEDGRFRQDLFYRLNVVPLVIPPLRERVDDIPRLASSFAGRIASRHSKSLRDLDHALLDWLRVQPWDGNVRELENIIERLVIFSTDGVLRIPDEGMDSAILPPYHKEKVRVTDEFELQYLKTALRISRGRLAEVCKRTGLSSRQLYNLIKKHELNKEDYFA